MVNPRRAAMRGATPLSHRRSAGRTRPCQPRSDRRAPASAFASVRMARRVVTPAERVPDTRSCRSTPPRRPSRCPHPRHRAARALRPVHERHGQLRQARLGARRGRDIGQAQAAHPHRRGRELSPDAAFSGWYYDQRRGAAPALHPRADRLGGRPVPGLAVPRREPATLGDPGARPRHDPRRVPPRRAGVPRARHHLPRRVVPQRRRGAAQPRRAPTRSARRSGATSTPPSGSPGAGAHSASS